MRDETDKFAEMLEKYSALEGSELGETWSALASMWNYSDYVSPAFAKSLAKEIKDQADYIKKNVTIVKEEITETKIFESLEFKDR